MPGPRGPVRASGIAETRLAYRSLPHQSRPCWVAIRSLRRYQARQRAEARQRARQAAKEELRSIVNGWNEAFALEAFFAELSRRAATLAGDERADLEARIETARELVGGKDAIDRFLNWKVPPAVSSDDEEAAGDEGDDEIDDDLAD